MSTTTVQPGKRSMRLLSVVEAAERLSVHKQTVYRLIWDGELTTVNVARRPSRLRLRVYEHDLEAWAARRELPASPKRRHAA